MRFGTWNVRSMYRAGFLMTVSREPASYRFHLVGVQEVRWEGNSKESIQKNRQNSDFYVYGEQTRRN
jgi:hypothetical protein